MEKVNWRKVLKWVFGLAALSSWILFVDYGAAFLLSGSSYLIDFTTLIAKCLAACIWTTLFALYKVNK